MTNYGQGAHTCYCSTEAVCKTGLGAWVDGGSCSNAACAAGTLFFCFRALSCSHWSELSEYWAGALRFPLTRRGRRRRPTSPRPRKRPPARRAPTTAWASHATSELGATLAARSGKPRAQSYRFAYNVFATELIQLHPTDPLGHLSSPVQLLQQAWPVHTVRGLRVPQEVRSVQECVPRGRRLLLVSSRRGGHFLR